VKSDTLLFSQVVLDGDEADSGWAMTVTGECATSEALQALTASMGEDGKEKTVEDEEIPDIDADEEDILTWGQRVNVSPHLAALGG